tara:strand:+ start:440 stop:1288 length:849 start_codon:yes stop_codon:yes gene_type:complete
MNIGIIGQGFVGTAIYEGLRNFYHIETYDIVESKSSTTLEKLVISADIIFQCLPTPMKKTGECDLSIVENSLENIDLLSHKLERNPIVVVKSTVPPGACERLNKMYEKIDIVFSPEFLTEANSIDDFKNQSRIILGGEKEHTFRVKQMFYKCFPKVPIIRTDFKTAEMVKYFTNNLLSTKISFANEMYEICLKLGIDYDKVSELTLYDSRIGKTHLMVPGPDGDFGFGGHCFPKDLAAMIYVAKNLGVEPSMLESTREKNNKVRKNRDWERMPGRAISKETK